MSLGKFGTERELLPIAESFEWFGTDVRVNPDASELDLIEFMSVAGDRDESDIAIIPALHRLLRAYVHQEDWSEFWKLARKNNQRTADFLELVKAVTAVAAGRPTERPSDSTDGRPLTLIKSTDGWRSEDVRALRALKPRPDLGMAVLLHHESIAAREEATG